jgi:hypothetical protein
MKMSGKRPRGRPQTQRLHKVKRDIGGRGDTGGKWNGHMQTPEESFAVVDP